MSAFVSAAPTLAKLSGARAPRAAATRRYAARAPVAASQSENALVGLARRASGVALGSAALTLTSAPPAHAMEGIFANPAVLGATCVMVCWGIPQTLGMAVLEKKEAAGRAKCAEWGIDVSDIEQGNWGRIRQLIKKEAERRGEEMPKF